MNSKNIDLYWFSGTGNTLLVVRRLTETLQAGGCSVRACRLENRDPASVPLEHTLGLAFPVSAFSTYSLVWRFIAGLPQAHGTEVFMLATLAGMSGLLVGPLRRALLAKGYSPIGARQIIMPSNYLWISDAPKNAKQVQRGLNQAADYAQDLLAGRAQWRSFSCLPLAWVRHQRRQADRFMAWEGKRLRVAADRCTRCGLCVSLCPVRNVELRELPVFLNHCEQCQRCLAFCPTQAIQRGRRNRIPYRAVKAADLLEG